MSSAVIARHYDQGRQLSADVQSPTKVSCPLYLQGTASLPTSLCNLVNLLKVLILEIQSVIAREVTLIYLL